MEAQNNNSGQSKIGLQFWVGLFAVLGMFCFSYIAINIAGMKLSNAGFYEIWAEFRDVSGLKTGAPVEIAGVKIGEVKQITLKETDAYVILQIKDGFQVRDDDIAQVRTKGIIGDKYVRLSPGGSSITVNAGEELKWTEPSVDFEEIIGKFIYSLNSKEEEKEEPKK
jgi:phospholipid/cholesterol/gamma-HCH transport system substrate-binding protein